MLIDLAITILIISGPVICLWIALWRTARYARRVGKTTHQYTAVALVGWMLEMIGATIGLGIIIDWPETRRRIPVAVKVLAPAVAYGPSWSGRSPGPRSATSGSGWPRSETRTTTTARQSSRTSASSEIAAISRRMIRIRLRVRFTPVT